MHYLQKEMPPQSAAIDLIEVRRLAYSCRKPERPCWDQPRLLGSKVRQDLDIGDRIGKREPISGPYLQRPQHFYLFAKGLWKTELHFADPDICDQEVVRNASNEFIYRWPVVRAGGEPRKMTPSYNLAIEHANETLGFLA
jgi:hypothetical protein